MARSKVWPRAAGRVEVHRSCSGRRQSICRLLQQQLCGRSSCGCGCPCDSVNTHHNRSCWGPLSVVPLSAIHAPRRRALLGPAPCLGVIAHVCFWRSRRNFDGCVPTATQALAHFGAVVQQAASSRRLGDNASNITASEARPTAEFRRHHKCFSWERPVSCSPEWAAAPIDWRTDRLQLSRPLGTWAYH